MDGCQEYDPEILYSADGGTQFVLKEELEKFHQAKAEKVTDETGEFIDLKPLLPFLDTEKKEIMGSEKMVMGLPEIKLRAKRMEPEKQVLKCFISYAHFYQDYFEVFRDDFEAATASLPFSELDIWTDEKIPLGEDWHKAIQEQVANCDIAILLVSDRFMTSEYIKNEEVDRLFERKESEGTLIIPVYFYPCRFRDWSVLKKNQLFKPKGVDHGHADKDKKERFCFADLVQFDNVHGKNIARNNPHRSRYYDGLR